MHNPRYYNLLSNLAKTSNSKKKKRLKGSSTNKSVTNSVICSKLIPIPKLTALSTSPPSLGSITQ